MFGTCVVYLGFITGFLGTVSLIKPLSFLGIASRGRGALVAALGVFMVMIGWLLPAREIRVTAPQTYLDQFVPVYQFNEYHVAEIAAGKEEVFRAIKDVTADEILFFRTLVWIRRFGRQGPESILNAPAKKPLLEVATRTSFLLLAEDSNREIVIGTLVGVPQGWRPQGTPTPEAFKALHEPGFSLAAMNFLVEETSPGNSRVITETRIYSTDTSARRRFAPYWRTIYPGSALIRRMWLRAIKNRAEKAPSRPSQALIQP